MPPWVNIAVHPSGNNLKFHLFNKLLLSTYHAGNVIVNRRDTPGPTLRGWYAREGNRCQTTNMLAPSADFQPGNLNPSWTQLSFLQNPSSTKAASTLPVLFAILSECEGLVSAPGRGEAGEQPHPQSGWSDGSAVSSRWDKKQRFKCVT